MRRYVLLLFTQKVLHTAVDDVAYVLVCQGIDNILAVSLCLYKTAGLQNAKLMGYCGLSNVEKLGYFAYAHLTSCKGGKYLNSCAVAKNLVKVCKVDCSC